MIIVGKARWPLIVGLPCLVIGLFAWRGIIRVTYEARGMMAYSGGSKQMDAEMKVFQSRPGVQVSFEKVPSHPRQLAMKAEGTRPGEVTQRLLEEAQAGIAESLGNQKAEFRKRQDEFQTKMMDLEKKQNQLNQDRKVLLSGPKQNTPRAELVAKIEELKARRQQLIAHYPTHSDIPLLAQQIQKLLKQMGSRAMPVMEKVIDLDRQINETKVRLDYYSRRLQETAQMERFAKPAWAVVQPIEKPKWPKRVDGWPLGAGVFVGLLGLGFVLFKNERRAAGAPASDGLWKPEVTATPMKLEVVSPEPATMAVTAPEETLPSDPVTEKAAELYRKWVEVATILYQPAAEPPQGVLDSVSPLLQESSDFLPEGHEVLARYLARSVVPGNLPAHVARTVLMTLTGAQEAGVSPEHRLAMALAALFHDLAVVPRPLAIQEEVGSEVGRLSASVLRRIPGLQPALLSMVEDILIGMDEFKLETWQNVASGSTLEPLSKVLREIDRFEKVMQKQKARLDRRVANQ